MQLWTDYEGVTIDGAYRLQELLTPEGRSAFFSTTGPSGEPRMVRLIECHFDEKEILARWRSVETLNHPNFLKLEHFGKTEIDDRPVVYAVLERVDTNLAEVLKRGQLSIEDVTQLGLSLVAALDVLHTHGFIHEHVEPRNIFALDEAVKLRSDCIREAPEEEEGRAAKRRDVRDLVNVLSQALTQREQIDGLADSALPKSFSQIVHKGLDGTWGLENIKAALEGHLGSKPTATTELENAAPVAAGGTEQKASNAAPETAIPLGARLPFSVFNEELNAESIRASTRKEMREEDQSGVLSSRRLGIGGVGALLVILLTWAFAHARNANRHESTRPAAASAELAQPSTQSSQQLSTGLAPQPDPKSVSQVTFPTSASSSAGWRVIAFTYNHRTDAEEKVSSIAHAHPGLEPAVFTPSGHSPYLISIGGIMDQQAAHALARRSRSLGLPHDTYAQNYTR